MAAFLKSLHFVFFDGRVTILDGPKCFLQGIAREELSAALVAFSGKHQDGTEPWHVDGPKAILLGLFFFVMRISHALLWRMLCTLMTLWALLFWSALREAVKATAAAEDTSMLQVRTLMDLTLDKLEYKSIISSGNTKIQRTEFHLGPFQPHLQLGHIFPRLLRCCVFFYGDDHEGGSICRGSSPPNEDCQFVVGTGCCLIHGGFCYGGLLCKPTSY